MPSTANFAPEVLNFSLERLDFVSRKTSLNQLEGGGDGYITPLAIFVSMALPDQGTTLSHHHHHRK